MLDQRRLWQKPKDQKEPLSSEILATMYQQVCHLQSDPSGLGSMGKEACLFDCIRLALFTGSRLSEYGQTKIKASDGPSAFNPVPDNPNVPPAFRGLPLAFVAGDFEFYDDALRILVHDVVLRDPTKARRLQVRFRYDKGPDNFTYRRYTRTGHYLCPVAAAISLLQRASRIHRDFSAGVEPVAMFLDRSSQRWTVRGSHIQRFMRDACIEAHPDPNHYLRRHIHCLTSHSMRVTAAVALSNAGIDVPMIAFRLRWKSDAVLLYLRDCWRTIGPLTANVLRGAYDDESFSSTMANRPS
jgi:hypothetical protein